MEVLNYPETAFEKLPVTIVASAQEGAIGIAREIAALIRRKQQAGEPAVLGLATGASPIGVYQELVRLHREENLSFQHVVTFNLDEYYPMQPDELQSYVHFMHEHLFDHVDIRPENVHIPDGTLPIEQVKAYCQQYEQQIEAVGGLDLQLLGIGRTGHIGFNEPGSASSSVTRLVKLDPLTITDAAKDFIKEEYVPLRALTMGVGTILKARRIVLMAWGEGKARILRETVEGHVSDEVPATFLQLHPRVQVVVDQWAALELTRIKTPWLVGLCNWDDALIRRAVIWLSLKTRKPILKLTDEDYKDGNLSELLVQAGNAYQLNLRVFNVMQRTITGWPGGKPNSNDSQRPERAEPAHKRVLIFSPHPDDDVISMGGTLLRLVDQGHDVHVAYQTSGNIAVFDDDARRFADFALDFARKTGVGYEAMQQEHQQVVEFLQGKKLGEEDSLLVQNIKALIRKGEAEAACRYCGVRAENVHFLNMPFYETGQVKKKPLGEADIAETMRILQQIQPHQVFAAGDLRDPHGTHRVCLDAIFAALARLQERGEPWLADCYLWLYRGAWQEWDAEEIEMAVPISPEELMRKRKAIFKHQSQKDSAVFPGNDKREFWQRSEDRNHTTAKLYDQLGFVEYEAIEAFVRWRF